MGKIKKIKESVIAVLLFLLIMILPLYLTSINFNPGKAQTKNSGSYSSLKTIQYYGKAQSGMLLNNVLKEKGNPSRWKAVDEIIKLNYKSASTNLIKCLEEKDDARLVWHTVRALEKFNITDAAKPLCRLIESNSTNAVKIASLNCLGSLNAAQTSDFIYKFTNSENAGLKLAAAASLASFKDLRAKDPLMDLINSDITILSIKAAQALTRLGSYAASEITSILSGRDESTAFSIALSINLEEYPEILVDLLNKSEKNPERVWQLWKLSKAREILLPLEFEQLTYQFYAGIESLRARALNKFFEKINPSQARKSLAEFMIKNQRYNDPSLRNKFRQLMRNIEKIASINHADKQLG
jgi:hypothetical protein